VLQNASLLHKNILCKLKRKEERGKRKEEKREKKRKEKRREKKRKEKREKKRKEKREKRTISGTTFGGAPKRFIAVLKHTL
jgi:hypothetical protein